MKPLPTTPSRRSAGAWITGLLVLALLAAVGLNLVLYPIARQHTQLVAASWGDAPGAPALYGAYVWVEGQAPALQVKLTLYIDRPSLWLSQAHEPRTLGTAASPQEAVQRWGQLRWDSQGLHVGTGPQAITIPAAEIQRHR